MKNRKTAPFTGKLVHCDTIEFGNTSYTGNSPIDIPNEDNDYSTERNFVKKYVTEDGIKPLAEEETVIEQKIAKQILKNTASKVFSSESLSFPVLFSEARSNLERTADMFSFLVDIYIPKMMETQSINEKLMYLTVGILAGSYIQLKTKKPWNPVLGETFVGNWENGTMFYSEQISHHPPVGAYELIGPNNSWKCHGKVKGQFESSVNSVEAKQEGLFSLIFEDGSEYQWEFPTMLMSGSLYGDKTVKMKGTIVVSDIKNKLESVINFAPKKSKKTSVEKKSANMIYGGIKSSQSKKAEFTDIIRGDICNEIKYNDKLVWNIDDNKPTRPSAKVDEEKILQSDSRYRLDRNLFISNKSEEADRAKVLIEEFQRREERLRKVEKPKKEVKKK